MVAKLFSHQALTIAEAERGGDMPVQFLPSTMLSWRAPTMVRAGVILNAAAKAREGVLALRRDSQPPGR